MWPPPFKHTRNTHTRESRFSPPKPGNKTAAPSPCGCDVKLVRITIAPNRFEGGKVRDRDAMCCDRRWCFGCSEVFQRDEVCRTYPSFGSGWARGAARSKAGSRLSGIEANTWRNTSEASRRVTQSKLWVRWVALLKLRLFAGWVELWHLALRYTMVVVIRVQIKFLSFHSHDTTYVCGGGVSPDLFEFQQLMSN